MLLLHYDQGGEIMPTAGFNHPHPYGAYGMADGGAIAIQNEREFARLCADVLLNAELPGDPRFANNEARCVHRTEFDAIINRVFGATGRGELVRRLRKARIAFGEVNDVAGLSRHPALRRTHVDSPTGPIDMPAPPAGARKLGPVPAIGAHSEAIRREFAG